MLVEVLNRLKSIEQLVSEPSVKLEAKYEKARVRNKVVLKVKDKILNRKLAYDLSDSIYFALTIDRSYRSSHRARKSST